MRPPSEEQRAASGGMPGMARGAIRFAVLVLLGLIVWAPGLRISYFGDDFGLVFETPPPHPIRFFAEPSPLKPVYRPVETFIAATVQRRFGLETWPIHLLILFLHGSLSWLVLTAGLGLGLSRLQAWLAALFMLVSQANAFAVLSNDTLSQVGATCCGYLSVWCLHEGLRLRRSPGGAVRGPDLRWWAAGAASFALALLFKETGVSFLLLALVVSVAGAARATRNPWERLRIVLLGALPYGILLAAYLLLRESVVAGQPSLDATRYGFRIGANVLRNLALSVYSAATPVSSVHTFSAWAGNRLGSLLVFLALTLVFGAAVTFGLLRSRRPGLTAVLVGSGTLALFPMLLLHRASELYAYNAMPCVALLTGLGLGTLLERSRGRPVRLALLVAALAALFSGHLLAVRGKAGLMRGNGERAASLLEQLRARAERAPPGTALVLVNPPGEELDYACFLKPGFHVLRHGLQRLHQLTGREDLAVFLVERREELDLLRARPDAMTLTLDGDRVVDLPRGVP